MTIENKYNIPRETVQRMVNDGVIPCSVKRHYEIFDMFTRLKGECSTCTATAVMYEVSDKMNESFENVKKVIYKFGKT